jgi:hypothetical protein
MSKWPMRGHFRYLRFKAFPMTPRTPQCEVFWASLSNSKHSGVPEDSKSPTLEVLGFTPTLGQSGVATHNFTNHYATLRTYKKHTLCNTWQPKDGQVVNTSGLISENDHTRTREINAVRLVRLIIHTWQKVGTMFGRTKHRLALQMRSLCGEWISKNIIGSICHKLGNILRKMGPLQKEFISIMSFPRKMSSQIMSI